MATHTSLRSVDTHRVFATTHSLRMSDTWSWVSGAVAAEFECSPDELSMVDDEDGDFVVLNGTKIVEVAPYRLTNAPRALAQAAE